MYLLDYKEKQVMSFNNFIYNWLTQSAWLNALDENYRIIGIKCSTLKKSDYCVMKV